MWRMWSIISENWLLRVYLTSSHLVVWDHFSWRILRFDTLFPVLRVVVSTIASHTEIEVQIHVDINTEEVVFIWPGLNCCDCCFLWIALPGSISLLCPTTLRVFSHTLQVCLRDFTEWISFLSTLINIIDSKLFLGTCQLFSIAHNIVIIFDVEAFGLSKNRSVNAWIGTGLLGVLSLCCGFSARKFRRLFILALWSECRTR